MLDKQQQKDVVRAAEAVSGALRDAVQATITDRSPEPARETVVEIVEAGSRSPTADGGNPAAIMTTYVLLHWVTMVREALVDEPDRVAEILAWVEENLGRRYRLRARYTSVALDGAAGVEEIAEYARALGADFMPSIVWLLAGAVARYGDGDADWLAMLGAAEFS
ncbi:MAG: hypothetical protein ACT4RN_04640 [Pseudonocardia sp.]